MIHLIYMALRVLLADDSSTIKKVIQLALQDFGVEVKAVPVGSDVESVARQFKPDLILADVLLAKKNGYEIAQDFKQKTEFNAIPIILMWSSFIAFDQDRFLQSKADDKIEKPFDAETLRQVVRKHVVKLQTNKIAPFLSFDLPEFVENTAIPTKGPTPLPKIELPLTSAKPSFGSESIETSKPKEAFKTLDTTNPASKPVEVTNFSEASKSLDDTHLSEVPKFSAEEPLTIPELSPLPDLGLLNSQPDSIPSDNLDDVDEFQQVPLPGRKKSIPSQEDWLLKKTFETYDPTLAKSISIPDPFSIDVSDAVISTMGEKDLAVPLVDLAEAEIKSELGKSPKTSSQTNPLVKPLPQNIDPIRLEELLREQVRDVLKEIAWRVVPDIAERVVREEMQRLLKEAERLP
jgi:CheY-like chemotaxis protein